MSFRTIVAAFGLLGAAAAQADVGVSIQFSQPGVFGRVDLGGLPAPQVIVPQPVLIAPPPMIVGAPPPPAVEPVYMWVPYEHRRQWGHYCHQYHACDRPVYFVNHDWYQRNVMVRAHEGPRDMHEREWHEHDHGHDGHDRPHDREGRHGDDHGHDDHGHGHDHDR